MKNDFNLSDNTRERVIFFLLFLTSQDAQQTFHRQVRPEKLAYELCRIWVEEIYAPSERYLTSLKGDYSKKKAAAFEDCFEVEELISLERFHRFIELRFDMLPEKYKQTQIFPINASWENITKDANYLLEELEPKANTRREALIEKVKTLLGSSDRMITTAWKEFLQLSPPSKPAKK